MFTLYVQRVKQTEYRRWRSVIRQVVVRLSSGHEYLPYRSLYFFSTSISYQSLLQQLISHAFLINNCFGDGREGTTVIVGLSVSKSAVFLLCLYLFIILISSMLEHVPFFFPLPLERFGNFTFVGLTCLTSVAVSGLYYVFFRSFFRSFFAFSQLL